MNQLFVTGDFDIGPILLSKKGRRRLPVMSESVCRLFETVESLTSAVFFLPDETEADRQKRDELGILTTKTANYLVEQIEAIVGDLNQENAIVYEGLNNGFVCGADGKAPVFIAQDVLQSLTLESIISSGMIDADFVTLVEAADKQGAEWSEVLENPKQQAEALGVTISEKTAYDLNRLAPSQLDNINDPATREYIAFFHAVLKDGRYLEIWQSKPGEVAEKLGIELSDEVIEKNFMLFPGGSYKNSCPRGALGGGAVVAIGIVLCIVVTIAVDKSMVTDRSGVEKL